MNLRTRLDHWLFEEYRTDTESLGVYRIMYCAYLLLATLPTGLWIKDLPQASFSPPVSLAALFTHYPPFWSIVVLNALTLLAACTLMIGWHTIASSFAVAIGLILVHTFSFADGKIDQEFIVVLIPVALAYSGWGNALSVDARLGRYDRTAASNQPWLLATLALLIGFSLFASGISKVSGGWLNPRSPGTRWHLLWNYYLIGRNTTAGAMALERFPTWVWKCMDWSVTLWESAFVLTVFNRRFCRVACALGTFFHLGVWLLFDITVAENLIAYAALVSWTAVWPPATKKWRQLAPQISSRAILGLCAAPFVVAFWSLFVRSTNVVATVPMGFRYTILAIAPVFAIAYLITLSPWRHRLSPNVQMRQGRNV